MNKEASSKILKNLLLIFSITMLCALFTVTVSAETISGECGKQGDNVTWSFDTETGVMTISGEGKMADYNIYSYNYTPWESYSCDIKKVIVCDGVTSVGEFAFGKDYNIDNPLTEVIISPTVKRIGAMSFQNCNNLVKVTGWTGVESIGMYTFNGCSSLEKIALPSGIKALGEGVFEECHKLAEIEIPDNVETIGDRTFYNCNSLKSISIPASVKEIILEGTFSTCSSLERIMVDPDNRYYSSDECGVLFDKDKTTLIAYPSGNKMTEYKMPNTVKTIYREAFCMCSYIENIRFSENLMVLNTRSFCDCLRLQNLYFPNSLKRMERVAVSGCWSLKNVVLPENTEYLGEEALSDCLSLESVSIKSMNTQIDDSALCGANFKINGISIDEIIDLYIKLCSSCTEEEKEAIWNELNRYMVYFDEPHYIGTIHCHAGSTAEVYAKENGIDYELVHFYGDWSYDWDNLVRSHKCDICGYTETEPLEKTEEGGVEIIKPIDPDTEFIVEEITKNGDKYAVVEKTLNENLEGSYSILKTFDITLKNKNGVHVQPNGTVKVKLPIDWDKDGNYEVYRVNDDGTLTDMEAYRQGSHMVFDSNHFSVYVIVDESPEQPGNDSPISFFSKLINMFKEFINKIIELFRSIGDLT